MMSITRLREKAVVLFGNDFEPFEGNSGSGKLMSIMERASIKNVFSL